MLWVTLFVLAVLAIAIYIVIEIKRLKHKLFAFFLIGLLLFGYISFLFVFKGQDVDFKTIPGIIDASKLYYSWVVSVFVNFWSVTTYAIKMDWGSEGNSSIG